MHIYSYVLTGGKEPKPIVEAMNKLFAKGNGPCMHAVVVLQYALLQAVQITGTH